VAPPTGPVDAPVGPRVRWPGAAGPATRDRLEIDLDPTATRPTAGLTIVGAIRGRVLDAELAGLLWLLVDGGVPLVVAGPGDDRAARAARMAVLGALLDLVPATRVCLPLEGDAEDFAWLGAAEALGWRRAVPVATVPTVPAGTLILAGELGAGPPADTTGDRARLVVRSLGSGFGLAATIEASRLEDVLAALRRRPIRLTDDELSNLGVVLVLGGRPEVAVPRIASAHYLRPLARDVHGHPQRLPPAVLAAWDDRIARFEHFAWGLAGELAARVGRRTGDFELERERRAAVLAALAAVDRGTPAADDVAGIRGALERGRVVETPGARGHRH
jgi:hypothetical protein